MSGIDAARSTLAHSLAARSALASLGSARPLAAAAAGALDPRAGTPAPDPHAQLRHLANQLEAVFLDQLFQAMRDAVPQGESSDAAGGEALFTKMFDERIASEAAEHTRLGLSDALYRQLSRRLSPEATPGAEP